MATKAPEVVPAIWTKHMEVTNAPPRKITVDCSKGDRTHQSFKDEVDINQVMKRYRLSGTIPQHQVPPDYTDYSNLGDYQDALNLIAQAKTMFEELPFEIRKQFKHSPEDLVAFCSDPNNQAEAIRLGIAAEPQEIPELDTAIPVSDGDIQGGE